MSSHVWTIGPIATPSLSWGATKGSHIHRCPSCQLPLLTGERPGFCCGPNGSRKITALPPLPQEYDVFINDPCISSLSRILNLVFSFASLETTQPFPNTPPGGPSFLVIQGKVYHRLRPTHHDSAVRWLLHDGFLQQAAPHSRWLPSLPPSWTDALTTALSRVNPFVMQVRNLTAISTNIPTAHLILQDSGTSPEIAAIMCYENTTRTQMKPRNLLISKTDGRNQTIPTVSRLWEPLAYPLFFPQGTLGWGLPDSASNTLDSDSVSHDTHNTPMGTQMWHYRARVLHEPRFSIFGRLANEYMVDMFSRDLDSRLQYIRQNQTRVLEEDASLMGETDLPQSENIYLPSSFLGSRRWSSDQIADSLTIAGHLGNPTFFVTMTCNPEWPEIHSKLRPGQDFSDIPTVVNRVFKQKLSLLLQTLKTKTLVAIVTRSIALNSRNVAYLMHIFS